MSGELESMGPHYRVALEAYLKHPEDDALRPARELGERAVAAGLGILDALAWHEKALQALPAVVSGGDSTAQAGNFLGELLTPLELEFRNSRETVLEQRDQIEAVSKELESFRYSVSHDLRAPLRAIEGFSAILEEEHADKLDEEGRHCLEIVRSSARRLGQLIEDLLLLVRVGRGDLSRQRVNVSDMAREVAAELERR